MCYSLTCMFLKYSITMERKKSCLTKDSVSKIREFITDTTVSLLIPRGKIHTCGRFSSRALALSLPTWIKLFWGREKGPWVLHLNFRHRTDRKGKTCNTAWLHNLGARKYVFLWKNKNKTMFLQNAIIKVRNDQNAF